MNPRLQMKKKPSVVLKQEIYLFTHTHMGCTYKHIYILELPLRPFFLSLSNKKYSYGLSHVANLISNKKTFLPDSLIFLSIDILAPNYSGWKAKCESFYTTFYLITSLYVSLSLISV